jgi:hypothetical protein
MVIENVYTYITNHEETFLVNMRRNQILLQVAAILLLVLLQLNHFVLQQCNTLFNRCVTIVAKNIACVFEVLNLSYL